LHELSTNAAKYGALSTDTGSVEITWRMARKNDEPWLVLDWRETGGPPVAEPKSKSFGTRLIERGLTSSGGVTLGYAESGLSCRIEAPLSELRPRDFAGT
jgi:two-component sensor histidine kinase